MSGVWDDAQLGLRPGSMQVPCAGHRTHNIVAALNDDPGNLPDLLYVLNQIIVRWEETVVHEVVAFDTREGERKLRVSKPLDRMRIKQQLGGAAFPDSPGSCGFDPRFLVLAG